MKVHQAVAKALSANEVDVIFGLMGDANMFMVDSFIRDCKGKFVPAANEAGAMQMALGYALASGRPGICSVTHGPALTNTLTGLIEGVRGRVPAVLISGDTPLSNREHLQDVAQREIALVAGAGFEQMRAPSTVAEDVARSLARAERERRPIVLNVPVEFDWEEAENFEPVRAYIPERRAFVAQSPDIDNAVGIIASARRPLILAGRGAVSPEARAALVLLAERTGAPLATTLKGKDLFEGEVFNLGICGTLSNMSTTEMIMEADCLIAFGASLNKYTTAHGGILKGKRIIQINLEVEEVGKNISVDAGLVGDPAQVADLIRHWLDEAEIPSSEWRGQDMLERIEQDRAAPAADLGGDPGVVDFVAALDRLESVLPPDRVLVTDSGRFMLEVFKRIRVPDPRSLIVTHNFGSIGLGVSHAIGASFGAGGRPVAAFCGDGGFMNGGLAEFNTAVRANADLIVIVMNDGVYGAEHYKFTEKQMDWTNISYDWPDFAKVAVSLGGDGITLADEKDWPAVAAAIEGRSRPLLIDVKVNPDKVPCEF